MAVDGYLHSKPGEVHTYAARDVFEHDMSSDCICGPDTKLLGRLDEDADPALVTRFGLGDLWAYTHRKLAVT